MIAWTSCLIALSHDHSENVRPDGKFINFPSASRVHEPTSGASRHLLPEEGGKNLSFIIVMGPAKPPEPALFSALFHIRFHIFGEVSGDGAVDDAARDDNGVDLLGFGCFFYSGLEVVLDRFHDFIFLLGELLVQLLF